MAANVVTSVSTIGSSTVYSDTVRVDSSVNPIVTTITRPASTVQTIITGGNSVPYTTVTNGSTVTSLAQIGFAYITSTVVPGETITSTVGFTTNLVTSSGRIAVATVPILATLTITNGVIPSITLPTSTTLSTASPSRPSSTFDTSTRSTTSSQSSSTDTTPTLNSSSSTKRISSATIGGIVAGTVLGIVVITILVFIILRRKRRRHAAEQSILPPTIAYNDKHELAGDRPPYGSNRWTPGVLPTRVKPELEASVQQCAELKHGNPSAIAAYNRLSEPMSNSIHEAPVPSDSASTVASNTPLIAAPPPSHSRSQSQSPPQVLQPIHNSNTLNQQPQRHRHAASQPTNESVSPKYFVEGPVSSPARHSMPAVQHQRGLSENGRSQVPDSLSQLRAEHEALMDRIRLAEMREREREWESVRRGEV